jgi:hypothetical protein
MKGQGSFLCAEPGGFGREWIGNEGRTHMGSFEGAWEDKFLAVV